MSNLIYILLLLGAGLIAYVYYLINTVVVSTYTVPVKGLPEAFDGFTILHISDLHAKEFGRDQSRLTGIINRHEFDMIALTGDLIDQYRPEPQAAVNLIKGLVKKPAFFVTGNHERWVKTDLVEALTAVGVTHLRNQSTRLRRGDERMWVVGVEAPHASGHMGEALLPIHDHAPKILLAHAPNIFASAVRHDIDVVLVGHTHGGQIRLPVIGAIYAPGQKLFPKYVHGLYSEGRTTMVVNAGLGESTVSIRLGIKPEVALVTLTPLA